MDESHIRELATEGSFRRGMDYYRRGAIIEPVRQGTVVRAQCRGSGYEPYQVSAALAEEGIENIRCTCPYNHGGICKHAVALLLTLIHEPEAFRTVPPLEEMLAGHDREELIALIGAIVEGQPDLLWRLEVLAGNKRNRAVDVEGYRRQLWHVLGHRSLDAVEWGLHPLTKTADELAEGGDWRKAGALYCMFLTEAVDYYDDETMAMDREGDFALLVGEFADGLIKCLEEGQPEDDLRRSWLEALLDAELRDIEMGGIDLAPNAQDALLAHATDGDWTWIEERVLEQMPESEGWRREELVNLLAQRRANAGRMEEVAVVVRELGTPKQQAFLLIEEGRIDEAMPLIDEIVADKPGLVTEFADALVEAGAGEVAVEFVTGHAEGQGPGWLAKYYSEERDWRQALEWQRKVFLHNPSVDAFGILRERAEKTARWKQMRADVLEALEREKRIGPLIDIALYEDDAGRALELLPRLGGWHWKDYRREVARAAERDYPREALKLYKEMVEDSIDRRQRDAYRQAAEYLRRAKGLYEALDAEPDWDAYIQTLRIRYANLPALQDELDKAHLLWRQD